MPPRSKKDSVSITIETLLNLKPPHCCVCQTRTDLLPLPPCSCSLRLILPPLPEALLLRRNDIAASSSTDDNGNDEKKKFLPQSDDELIDHLHLRELNLKMRKHNTLCKPCIEKMMTISTEVLEHEYHDENQPNPRFTVEVKCPICKTKYMPRVMERMLKNRDREWEDGLKITEEFRNVFDEVTGGVRKMKKNGTAAGEENDDDDDDDDEHECDVKRVGVARGELLKDLLERDPKFKQEYEDEMFVKKLLETEEGKAELGIIEGEEERVKRMKMEKEDRELAEKMQRMEEMDRRRDTATKSSVERILRKRERDAAMAAKIATESEREALVAVNGDPLQMRLQAQYTSAMPKAYYSSGPIPIRREKQQRDLKTTTNNGKPKAKRKTPPKNNNNNNNNNNNKNNNTQQSKIRHITSRPTKITTHHPYSHSYSSPPSSNHAHHSITAPAPAHHLPSHTTFYAPTHAARAVALPPTSFICSPPASIIASHHPTINPLNGHAAAYHTQAAAITAHHHPSQATLHPLGRCIGFLNPTTAAMIINHPPPSGEAGLSEAVSAAPASIFHDQAAHVVYGRVGREGSLTSSSSSSEILDRRRMRRHSSSPMLMSGGGGMVVPPAIPPMELSRQHHNCTKQQQEQQQQQQRRRTTMTAGMNVATLLSSSSQSSSSSSPLSKKMCSRGMKRPPSPLFPDEIDEDEEDDDEVDEDEVERKIELLRRQQQEQQQRLQQQQQSSGGLLSSCDDTESNSATQQKHRYHYQQSPHQPQQSQQRYSGRLKKRTRMKRSVAAAAASASSCTVEEEEEGIDVLTSMGFSREQAIDSFRDANGDLELAVSMLCSNSTVESPWQADESIVD